MTLEQWIQIAGSPHTELRGNRIAVCTEGLFLTTVARLYELEDYFVWSVNGPYTELALRFARHDLIRICCYCQVEFQKEPVPHSTHGLCARHFRENMIPLRSSEWIDSYIRDHKDLMCPDMAEAVSLK